MIAALCVANLAVGCTEAAKNEFLKDPLFEPAVDYTTAKHLPDCTPRNGERTIYHECLDSDALYEAAIVAAKAKGQPLMVLFGFDECPSCAQLDGKLFPKKPLAKIELTDFVSDKAYDQMIDEKSAPTISVVRIHIRNKNAEALAERLGVVKMANDRGWHRLWSPFILMVDPKTGKMHSEESWRGSDYHCYGYMSEIATNLEALKFLPEGKLPKYREMCKDNDD